MNISFEKETFAHRHNGNNPEAITEMLETIKAGSIDQLIDETIPVNIRLQEKLNLPKAQSEVDFLANFKKLASKNKIFKSSEHMIHYIC